MLAPIPSAPLEAEPTTLDAPRVRRVAVRSVSRDPGAPSNAAASEAAGCLGVRGNPGQLLARAPLAAVRLREAIVRRNHQIDVAERAPPNRPPGRVKIDGVRSRDADQRIRLEGTDTLRIVGVGAGRPGRRAGAPAHRPVTPLTPAVSVAIDGLVYTVPVRPGASPRATFARLRERLERDYAVEILSVSDGELVARLDAPILRRAVPAAPIDL